MKEIGGYFELMVPKVGGHYHPGALRLNTAGSAFRLLLSAYEDKHVYMPNYVCDSMVAPLAELGVDYTFYPVNKCLEAEMLPELGPGERFLYVNYFGVKGEYVKALSRRYRDKLIVDNAQSFFSAHDKVVDSIYSARKFFGVPDGAYWYPSHEVSQSLLSSFRHPIVTMVCHTLAR